MLTRSTLFRVLPVLLVMAVNTVFLHGETDISRDRLEQSIAKAQKYLLSLQKDDGSWAAPIRINPRETAYFIVTARYLNIPGLEKDIVTSCGWLLDHVNDDSGWGFFDKGGRSNISITAIVYLALKTAGIDEKMPVMRRASDFIENNGGIKAADIFCKTFYALFNLYKEPWNDPRAGIFFPPLEILYLDKDDENGIYSNIAWGREAAVALSIIKEYKNRDNLFLKEKLIREGERWIVSHQLEDGCWYTLLGTCLNMIALNEINGTKHRPRILHAMSWINKMRDPDGYQRRFELGVWDTSFCIQALVRAGMSPSHPALIKAGQWLIDAQTVGGGRLWSNVPSGGWSYNRYNILYPDNDDSALAVTALQTVLFRSFSMEYRKAMAVERGKMWLLYMQNDDGGWGTFCRFNGEKDFGLPPDATQDPSVADITGHVLFALGSLEIENDHPVVKKAAAYLQKDQNRQGLWYGRWGLCYLYGTACVLEGLAHVHYDMKAPFIRKALGRLLALQNKDGGWGEHFDYWDNQRGISYTKPGPSTPEQTAWILSALIAVDDPKYHNAIKEGIAYLLHTQDHNGNWHNPHYTVLGLNPYRNTYYPIYFPLVALSDFADRQTGNRFTDTVKSQPPATFRMVKDSMPRPAKDDFAIHYLTPPAIDVTIRPTAGEQDCILDIVNTGDAPADDLEIRILETADHSIVKELYFKTLEIDDPVSQELVLPGRKPDSEAMPVHLLARISYKHRGLSHSREDKITLPPPPRRSSLGISPGNLLGLSFLLVFAGLTFILFKKTGKELSKYAIRNLSRNKLRNGLSFVGIVIGIAATAGTISLGLSFEDKLKEDFKSFGAGRIVLLPQVLKIDIGPPQTDLAAKPPLELTGKVVDRLKKIDNVESVCPVIHYQATVSYQGEGVSCFIQFVDPRSFERVSPLHIAKGTTLQKNDLFVAAVGHDVANKAFSKKIDVGSILKIGDYKIKVKGIFAGSQGLPGKLESIVTPNILVYLPLDISNRFLLKESYDALELKVSDTAKIEATDKAVNGILKSQYPGKTFGTVYTEKLQAAVSGILDQFNTIIAMIGIFCLLVSGIGIMNIMIVNVNERRPEIGILKSLGADGRTLLKVFLTELSALGFLSAVTGFICGLALIVGVQAIARIYTPPNLTILFANSIFLGEFVVILFGIGPVIKELKKEPVDSIEER